MRTSFLSVCFLALFSAGCGPSNRPPTHDEGEATALIQVGDLCRYYQLAKKKAPTKLSDLASVNSLAGNGYEAVRTGEIVLIYNAMLTDTGDDPGQGTSDEVLAYQKKVPESGGKVLMLNRSVRTMTAEEFKAAKKAAKG
jgi:hypothetical protein